VTDRLDKLCKLLKIIIKIIKIIITEDRKISKESTNEVRLPVQLFIKNRVYYRQVFNFI